MSDTTVPAHALTPGERAVIDFFSPKFQALFAPPVALPGAAYFAAKVLLGMSLTRAAQAFNNLLDDPRALNYRPEIIMRGRTLREARQRFPRRRLADHADAQVSA